MGADFSWGPTSPGDEITDLSDRRWDDGMTRRSHIENAGETMGRRNRKGEPLARGEALAPLGGDRVQVSFQVMEGAGWDSKVCCLGTLCRRVGEKGVRGICRLKGLFE